MSGNPYVSPALGRSEEAMFKKLSSILAKTRSRIRFLAVFAAIYACYCVVGITWVIYLYVSQGVLIASPVPAVYVFVGNAWAAVNVVACPIIAVLLWRYSDRLGNLMLRDHESFELYLRTQYRVWFAACVWFAAMLLLNVGARIAAAAGVFFHG